MADEKKSEVKKAEVKKTEANDLIKKSTKFCKKNPWMIASIILALVLILLLVVGWISIPIMKNSAGNKIVAFLNEKTGGGVELVSVESDAMFYTATVSYQGQEIPVSMTKNGKYFIQGFEEIILSGEDSGDVNPDQGTSVPKSDKPIVELFVWGYCPYGVQAQGPLAEVASLLEDYADFNTILYYDGHGPFETQQNKIQACMQEVAKDKYWDYAAGFVTDIYSKCSSSRDVECDKSESIKLMKSLGIDDSKVMSCVNTQGESLIQEHSALAQAYGVTGSPTLIINGVTTNVARSAESYKVAVCEAFNNAPVECAEVLDASSATASGNC